MELAVSGGSSRAQHSQPHHHPHQGHPYDAYQSTSPRGAASGAPLVPPPASSSSSKRREQQQQEYAYHGSGGHLPATAASGYPPPPGYYPAQPPPPHSSHGSPGMTPHGGPSTGSGSSRHAYVDSNGYAIAPSMAPPMHPQAHLQHPHHPQHYPHMLGPPQHIAAGYYEGDMMDLDAHYAAQQQQHHHHHHHHMGYTIPPPGIGDPRMGYPQPMPPHQHDPRTHDAYSGVPHPPPHGHNPPTKAKAKSSSRKEKKDKQHGGASTKATKGDGRSQAAKEAKAEAAAQAKEAAAAAAAAAAGASTESKKDKKKREVVERVFRMHAETMDNRENLFQKLQHQNLAEHTALLTSPLLSRKYQLNLSFLTLQREAALRRIALLHAHQVETARKAYDLEKSKVDEEARQARKTVRERLTAAVEERRKKLKEEKESGEGAGDTLLESSSRPHATRKLRNKLTGSSRRLALASGDIDSGDESSVAGGPSNSTTQGKDRNKDGSILLGGASSTTHGNGLAFLAGSKAMDASAPILGLHGLPELSLLQSSLRVFEREGRPRRNEGAARGKGGRKGAGGKKGRGAAPDRPASPAPEDDDEVHLSKKAKKELERDRLSFLALAASSLPATLTGTGGGSATGGGILSSGPGPGGSKTIRWEPGRSVLQLTGAKDYEAESDLIRIRGGIGGGKRRRGAAAAAA